MNNQPSLLSSDLDSLTTTTMATEPSLESSLSSLQHQASSPQQHNVIGSAGCRLNNYSSIEDEMLLLRLIDLQQQGAGDRSR